MTRSDASDAAATTSRPLTLKRQVWRASRLLAELEDAWQAIANDHGGLPPVVVTIASGELPQRRQLRLGRFSPCAWQHDGDEVAEVLIGAEGLARGAEPVLATLLHEAAHGLAYQRQIRDTSRGGRYHNRRYLEVAQSVGLQVAHHPQLGWSSTTLSNQARDRYSAQVRALDAALQAHRHRHDARAARGSGRNLLGCRCRCGRRIRVSAAALAQAPIVCERCGHAFTPDGAAP
jgi:hypothetical protein